MATKLSKQNAIVIIKNEYWNDLMNKEPVFSEKYNAFVFYPCKDAFAKNPDILEINNDAHELMFSISIKVSDKFTGKYVLCDEYIKKGFSIKTIIYSADNTIIFIRTPDSLHTKCNSISCLEPIVYFQLGDK
jgi:hypothetical protein